MCSFLFGTKVLKKYKKANRVLQFRGPDYTKHSIINGHTYIHNLLSITGAFTPQPLSEDNIYILFNGEIYNFRELGDYDNDTKCIIPLYKEYGPSFTKHLDGEFALTLVDYNKNLAIISSDIFKTKPLFYSIEDGHIASASYQTPLIMSGFKNVQKANSNETLVVDLKATKIIDKFEVYSFDLRQHKKIYADWTHAFENSIRKRARSNVREKIFIGISSGYDSGAIACEMAKQQIYFKGYSHIGSENTGVLNSRKERLRPYCEVEQYKASKRDLAKAHKFIKKNTEPFYYTIYSGRSDYNEFDLALIDDNGSNQFSVLSSKAKKDIRKIHLSGIGGDEIFSDYGFGGESKYAHSNFGGLFPEDLSTIFPWPSFYGSSMESYLAKEEYVGGAYGLESRYPFLDKDVVQEFLWLDFSLKNNNYKNVLHNYFIENDFPFDKGQKIGF